MVARLPGPRRWLAAARDGRVEPIRLPPNVLAPAEERTVWLEQARQRERVHYSKRNILLGLRDPLRAARGGDCHHVLGPRRLPAAHRREGPAVPAFGDQLCKGHQWRPQSSQDRCRGLDAAARGGGQRPAGRGPAAAHNGEPRRGCEQQLEPMECRKSRGQSDARGPRRPPPPRPCGVHGHQLADHACRCERGRVRHRLRGPQGPRALQQAVGQVAPLRRRFAGEEHQREGPRLAPQGRCCLCPR
mmetsp:Transcript_16320/g.38737  ORF Transcript_16320/g.38737 Transcript_16320/m.38737 type:complete len:245 (-) Transcript_16320:2763-3497(-)